MIPETGALAELLRLPDAEKQARGLVHTPSEIAVQPHVWRQTVQTVRGLLGKKGDLFQALLGTSEPPMGVLMVGAGSSYYAAEYAANLLLAKSGLGARAIPTTDLVTSGPPARGLDYPGVVLVSLARSGNSPESLETVRMVRRAASTVLHLGIVCNPAGALVTELDDMRRAALMPLPEAAHDQGLAMTVSFTTLALGALLLGHWTRSPDFPASIERAALAAENVLGEPSTALREVAQLEFNRAVVLAPPWLLPAAREGALKLQEMTNGQVASFAETYLGLRHGPQAMVNKETLVIAMLSGEPEVIRYERDMLAELKTKKQGSHFLLIGGNSTPPQVRKMADTFLEHAQGQYGICGGLVNVVPIQILSLFASLARGLTPDNPSPDGVINREVQGVKIYKK